MTPPFASSRILRANGSASLVALPVPGVVRPLSLSACLGDDFPHLVFASGSDHRHAAAAMSLSGVVGLNGGNAVVIKDSGGLSQEHLSRPHENLSPRRNHRGQRSEASALRRRRRFDEFYEVSFSDKGAISRADETMEDHVEDRSPNGDSSAALKMARADAILPAAGDREPTLLTAAASGFTFLNANVRAIRRKTVDITRLLERCDFPTFLVFTETWLDKALEELRLPGYVEVSRRDRGSRSGGVMVFAKAGFENAIVHVGDSDVAERSWHIIHSNRGPILFGAWYRPPKQGEVASIESIDAECLKFGSEALGTILVGDMNVHESGWLRYSDGTSVEGRLLHDIACSHGWEERVKKPTRGQYLLDLVLTDLGTEVTTKVVRNVSDHEAVLGTLNFEIDEVFASERKVYDFKKASWSELTQYFRDIDWTAAFADGNADNSAQRLLDTITEGIDRFIPSRMISKTISTHPWINDRCRRAIDSRLGAAGTVFEISKRDECSRVLVEEYDKYVNKMRKKLHELPSSTRGWWRLANFLGGKRSKSSRVQALKSSTGDWARSPAEKAELLADTFAAKSVLPDISANEYSAIPSTALGPDVFLPIRTKDVRRVLQKLKEDSATGPDGVATRVLKNCADGLALPLAIILRQMLACGCWPTVWREHWVVPLYKKKARSDPGNYRGVHLTSQLSKAAERILGNHFQRFLEQSQAYGPRQFAYTKARGHRDALALSVFTWLLALERGDLVALFCSDVSGAFDRVSSQRLVRKLSSLGLHPRIAAILESWLRPRVSKVVVEGSASSARTLENSVFQGTVWGPPLWNVYYADASVAVRKTDFIDIVFADDLNCTRILPKATTNAAAFALARLCQSELHKWGGANQVMFDPSKESFHIIHRTRGEGENFTILGIEFDTGLLMHNAARNVAVEAGWRLKTLLRTRRFHTKSELIKLYKSQILSFIESRTVGIHHAAPSVLACVDRVQRRFLREIDTTSFEALVNWRLAPLGCRREMAMLGLLYRIAHKIAPPCLCQLFEREHRIRTGIPTRGAELLHDLQFKTFIAIPSSGRHTDTIRRSCFGLCTLWNMLPANIVHSNSVKLFQRKLQLALISYAESNATWEKFFEEARHMPVYQVQRLFV